jgi:NADPH:quinone reductase-like Zn-dependent oxidoreductase
MRALVLERPGKPDTLHETDMPKPEPGEGEVRVKVHAVGLNPVDYKLAASGFPTWDYPMILGWDIAGVVDECGPDVAEWEVGDPVYYHGDITKPGGYSQYTIAAAHALSWMPDGLDYEAAAALPCAGFTAYQAIHRKLRVQAGKTMLVHGGAGGVGGFAVQLAKAAGVRVFATCSPHNEKFVKDLGAELTIDYRIELIPDRIEALTDGRGVDYIIDTVDSESATQGLDMLAYGGEMVCVAGLPDLGSLVPNEKGISVHEVALGGVYRNGDQAAQEELSKIGQQFGALVSKGVIRPMVQEVITLTDVPDALERLSMRHVRGKIVAKVFSGK